MSGVPSGGDRLAEMRELALAYRLGGRSEKYQRDGEWGSFPADNVLALVEIAKQARVVVEHDPDETDGRQHLHDLAAALARLDSEATEENT